MSKASFLCAVTSEPESIGVMPLAHRGIDPGEHLKGDGGIHPLNVMISMEIPSAPGFYVWEGQFNIDAEANAAWKADPSRKQPEVECWWSGSFRPAAAGDFERFGFPIPGGFALGTLRRIEALAVEGARSLPRTQLAARGALDEIRGEAARALACELAPAGRKPGPTVVCLCGSTRFLDAFREANRTETLAGRIVLSVGMFGHHEGLDMDGPVKAMLDRLHLAKIDLADEVLILNLDGYIGESTRRELAYARETGKVVRFLEPEGAIG
jgi:hypothetical protein